MFERKITRPVHVGDLTIGGGAQIVIQSMNNTDTRDVQATLRQIEELAEAGCDLTRLAIPDQEAAQALAREVRLLRRQQARRGPASGSPRLHRLDRRGGQGVTATAAYAARSFQAWKRRAA